MRTRVLLAALALAAVAAAPAASPAREATVKPRLASVSYRFLPGFIRPPCRPAFTLTRAAHPVLVARLQTLMPWPLPPQSTRVLNPDAAGAFVVLRFASGSSPTYGGTGPRGKRALPASLQPLLGLLVSYSRAC